MTEQRFHQIVGEDAASRPLFDRMVAQDIACYEALKSGSITFAAAYAEKFEQLRSRFAERDRGGPVVVIRVDPSDVATLLLLGQLSDLPSDDPTHLKVSSELFRREIAEVIRHDESVGQLFNAWALSLGNDVAAWRAMRLASDQELRQALPAATALAGSDKSSANLRAMAIGVIGRVGGRQELATLRRLLGDARVVAQENVGFTDPMQVRDLAAITMIELAGLRPADYGLIRKPQRDHVYTALGFASDEDRASAIEAIALTDGSAQR